MELLNGPVLLIANPAARRAASYVDAARRAFRASGLSCDAVLTERPGHAAELATARGGEYAAVFALGGDGTAMEIIDALAYGDVPVGVLPGGTGNLVAHALRIPLRIDRAVHALVHGAVAAIDLGRIDGARRFVFAAGVGIDARMVRDTPAALKRRVGFLAYALTASKHALRHTDFHARIDVDGVVHERRAVGVLIANFGVILSPSVMLGPSIRYDDGMLDVCVLSPSSSLDSVRLASRLLRRDFRLTESLHYMSGKSIRVECDPPQLFQADGELLGTSPFSAHVEPLAAKLLVPRPD